MLRAELQSARMSKITNRGLTRSGTGCFICDSVYPYGNGGRQKVKKSVFHFRTSFSLWRVHCLHGHLL